MSTGTVLVVLSKQGIAGEFLPLGTLSALASSLNKF